MQELNITEVEQVNGGIIPVLIVIGVGLVLLGAYL
jgi:lactobin A/cerein 7B family class IIb bacteriocin